MFNIFDHILPWAENLFNFYHDIMDVHLVTNDTDRKGHV